MKSKLKKLENIIFFGEHSDEEWRKIEKEAREEFEKATEEEKREFIDSGAGPLLEQVLEYIE